MRYEVAHLPLPSPHDVPVLRGPLCAAVPGEVVVAAVPVLLPVGVVVLVVVRAQVRQHEAIVGDDEVQAVANGPVRESHAS